MSGLRSGRFSISMVLYRKHLHYSRFLLQRPFQKNILEKSRAEDYNSSRNLKQPLKPKVTMKKHPRLANLIKAVIFVLLAILMVWGLTKLMQPKYYYQSSLKTPETEMWNEFYSLPEDDVDILFIGASTVYCGVDIPEFQEETGLRAYTVASSSARVYDVYYLLKEALRFQSPKKVVMDMGSIRVGTFSFDKIYKRTYDNMKWSSVKMEAVKGRNEHLIESEPLVNRFLTLMDFHSRWDELTEVDFTPEKFRTVQRGYIACEEVAKNVTHDYYAKNKGVVDDYAVEYFHKIVDLCKENQIELVLVKVPTPSWNETWHKKAVKLANEAGLPFIDYNDDANYPRIGLVDAEDWRDSGHLNKYGAAKFTPVIAEDLSTDFRNAVKSK